jgi:hypothetical protein
MSATGARAAARPCSAGGASRFQQGADRRRASNDIGIELLMSRRPVSTREMLRNANSVLYGNDALTGVISVTTRRGRTHGSLDGGPSTRCGRTRRLAE